MQKNKLINLNWIFKHIRIKLSNEFHLTFKLTIPFKKDVFFHKRLNNFKCVVKDFVMILKVIFFILLIKINKIKFVVIKKTSNWIDLFGGIYFQIFKLL